MPTVDTFRYRGRCPLRPKDSVRHHLQEGLAGGLFRVGATNSDRRDFSPVLGRDLEDKGPLEGSARENQPAAHDFLAKTLSD
jgi:hypothetical protein